MSNRNQDVDRFSGEFIDPPVWDYCDVCGQKIYLGCKYYDDDCFKICEDCAEKSSSYIFEKLREKVAEPNTLLIM